ncbi:uncharacterized protein LOC130636922 [Hydractinia symbiolongicarpus]|uniref:uncharacterized protein LOC130636922 n=1 Tax=Hydractinia symbiolongicarpus TaxID=13093 RepID=UPI00254B6890|nr:uncharacterized protein LOC130636922 [Hydractinia symbiolongicarpus]
MLGFFHPTIEREFTIVTAPVYVIHKESAGNLIGYSTANDLKLLQINNVNNVSANQKIKDNAFQNVPNDYRKICEKFQCLCHRKGKFLNYKCKLKINENVRPIQQRLRRQPYQLRKAIKEKIESMEKDGSISKVDSPQEWLSNIVVTPK